ncbi:MAG: hypothetical protein CMI55_00115 [Parcubacteria group bacterium]|jgi:hypothetical protein|nr:hypothetical protein [Parcubacteria group bacterium]|tara:strand:+ start:6478 stop:6966 length:489 start_codon:yes stop_codon:yes gene_type:complete
MNKKNKKISENKKRLVILKAKGDFVFHGSSSIIKELEPRQPMIYDEKIKKEIKHGNLCVAATPFISIALFRAIINKQNFPFKGYQSSFGFSKQKNKCYFNTTERVFSQIKGKKGYVHVLSKKNFKRFSTMEYRSERTERPSEIISVDYEDLPDDIEIIDDPN